MRELLSGLWLERSGRFFWKRRWHAVDAERAALVYSTRDDDSALPRFRGALPLEAIRGLAACGDDGLTLQLCGALGAATLRFPPAGRNAAGEDSVREASIRGALETWVARGSRTEGELQTERAAVRARRDALGAALWQLRTRLPDRLLRAPEAARTYAADEEAAFSARQPLSSAEVALLRDGPPATPVTVAAASSDAAAILCDPEARCSETLLKLLYCPLAAQPVRT